MHVLIEADDTDERIALFGVSDYQTIDDGVVVFWPTHSIKDKYAIDAEQHLENHHVISAVDSQAQDLQSLLDKIHTHDQEGDDITILPSAMFPIYERAVREIGHDDSFGDPTDYTPIREVHA